MSNPKHTFQKKDPYTCPRCGYVTNRKSNMHSHLAKKKVVCPATKQDIDLTDAVKEYILTNRIYHPPKKEPSVTNKIINNYNQFNTINNIVANMDMVEKLEHYMNYKGHTLLDFETTVENNFKKTACRLDKDDFKHSHYLLEEDRLLQMVDKAGQSHVTDPEPLRSTNVIFDTKYKEIKVYDGTWESMAIDAGTKHYMEVIQRNFLNSYERYLIRNIKRCREGHDRNMFKEMLEKYFAFIGCFNLEPFCKTAFDDEILNPSSLYSCSCNESEDGDEDASDDESTEFTTAIQDEFYPLYKKSVQGLRKQHVNKMIKSVQDMIKRNTLKNTTQLNKKVTTLFQMDETFRDLLMEINRNSLDM